MRYFIPYLAILAATFLVAYFKLLHPVIAVSIAVCLGALVHFLDNIKK